ATGAPNSAGDAGGTFVESFKSFFQKKHIVMMLLVVFFYRFGEGLIEKVGPLFMLDTRDVGGLGLDNQALGNINGTFGTLGFIIGALIGGASCVHRSTEPL